MIIVYEWSILDTQRYRTREHRTAAFRQTFGWVARLRPSIWLMFQQIILITLPCNANTPQAEFSIPQDDQWTSLGSINLNSSPSHFHTSYKISALLRILPVINLKLSQIIFLFSSFLMLCDIVHFVFCHVCQLHFTLIWYPIYLTISLYKPFYQCNIRYSQYLITYTSTFSIGLLTPYLHEQYVKMFSKITTKQNLGNVNVVYKATFFF